MTGYLSLHGALSAAASMNRGSTARNPMWMRLMRIFTFVALLSCLACAAGTERSAGTAPSVATRPPAATAPAPGAQSNDGFGNAMQGAPMMGTAGGTAPRPATMAAPACSPGLYIGTYDCDVDLGGIPLPLSGDVSFNLSIDETAVPGQCGAEFCPDLVISENSGTLFGFAGAIAFETKLQGALDCKTGEFKAHGIDGRYGNGISTDPNNPNALWTVEDPPYGMFNGMLAGMHHAGSPELIDGNWDLADTASGTSCNGPFKVVLQPPKP